MMRFLLPAAVGAGMFLASCGAGVAYYAPGPPPPVRVETFGVAPGPGFVWINGYWGYRGSAHVWIPGRWERPPRQGRVWVEGAWERHGNRWAYRRGYWR
jgi:WXXGXW repeat (2 copies)